MRKALLYIAFLFSAATAWAQLPDSVAVEVADTAAVPQGKIVPMKGAFLLQSEQRDSVLIGDQLLYGVEMRLVEEGTQFALPEWQNDPKGGVIAVSPWILDTLKVTRQRNGLPRLLDIRAGLVITSFDEGQYELPRILMQRYSKDGAVDTLVFDPMRLEVKTMPVDTATFEPHPMKDQIRYPVTVQEVAPWVFAVQLLAALIILAVCLYIIYRKRDELPFVRKEPAHIVALRKLDGLRGKNMWAPEKQKAFYSGVTDALREYIADRYGVGAMEMTTAELFRDMKNTDAPEELLKEMKALFETADFVKFAKYVASDEDNAAALPLAVRFVTETYQAQIVSDDMEVEEQKTEEV